MSRYRTIGEIEEYLRNHPEEGDDYIVVLFDEYAESGDTAALMISLRLVSRVKGVSRIAETSGLTRKGVQKALSEHGNPQFGSVNAIMHAMGYRLISQKLSSSIPESMPYVNQSILRPVGPLGSAFPKNLVYEPG